MKKILPFLLLALYLPFISEAKLFGPAYPEKSFDSLNWFAKEIAKKHHLKFLNSGVGNLADSENGLWAISFVSDQQLTLEKARILASNISCELFGKITKQPCFSKYCEITRNRKDLKKEDVGFRLAFWDEHTNRPLYPYLAQVRLADGNLYYHYADPKTHALQDPIIEPFSIVLD